MYESKFSSTHQFFGTSSSAALYAILNMQTAVSKTKTLTHDKTYFLKLFISTILFLFSGILSTYLYYNLQGKGGVYFPGLLYTSSTIIIFLLTKKSFTVKNLLIYYFLMIIVYLVIWLLTMLSVWFAFLGGIVTAGAGAILTFILVDKFVTGIKFSKVNLFIIGGLAFFITDFLYFVYSNTFDKTPIEYIFKVENSPDIFFLEVFTLWHTLVGTKLFLILNKG